MTDDLDNFLSKRADDNNAREQAAQRQLRAKERDERTLSESSGPEFTKLLELMATTVDGRAVDKYPFQWDAKNMVLRLDDASLNFSTIIYEHLTTLTQALVTYYYPSGRVYNC